MKTVVVITSTFSAVHHWPQCPFKEVEFLQHPHRHLFHVTLKFPVQHDDRDIEFILAKNRLDEFLRKFWDKKFIGRMSCEMMCAALLEHFTNACFCSVFEDAENGAEMSRD